MLMGDAENPPLSRVCKLRWSKGALWYLGRVANLGYQEQASRITKKALEVAVHKNHSVVTFMDVQLAEHLLEG